MVFIPFPAGLLGQYPEQQIAVIIYGGTLVITRLVLQLLWWYATSHYRLVDREIDPQLMRRATRRNVTAIAGWVSVLMVLKAAVDLGVDLRNHDQQRTWETGFADN